VKVQRTSVGLDVHARSVVACGLDGETGEVLQRRLTPDHAEIVAWLGDLPGPVAVTYEAGPTGFGLARALTTAGISCEVAAPSKLIRPSGDRVKTDARDAAHLARLLHLGQITAVTVPSASQEAARDLVRAREVAKQDQLRARNRLSKFLLRHGRRAPAGIRAWTQKFQQWIKEQVHFEQPAQEFTLLDYLHEVEHMADRIRRLEQAIAEAVKLAPPQMQEVIQSLQALRGIAQISAITLVAELGEISRFEGARQLMGYSGAVPSEDSSGKRIQRGPITKTGNTHLRRIAIEAAWAYRHRPAIGMALRKRQEGLSEEVKEIACKAQHRLNKRYRTLTAAGKEKQKVVTAVGRELLGFIWAIGVQVERNHKRVA